MVQKGPMGHFRLDLCSEKVAGNGPFSDFLATCCIVCFLSLFECCSDVHNAHFMTQNGSEKWCEMRPETKLAES